MPTFASKTDLDKGRFALLVHDDYELVVDEVKEDMQEKYGGVKDKEGNPIMEQIVNIVFKVMGFRGGVGICTDEEGKDAVGRKVFFTARPASCGFMRDGTPSKTRTLVAYALGQDVSGEIVFDDWLELQGRTLYAEVIQKETPKGKRNAISRFLLPPRE